MSLFDLKKHQDACATKLLINELNNKYKKNILKRASDIEEK